MKFREKFPSLAELRLKKDYASNTISNDHRGDLVHIDHIEMHCIDKADLAAAIDKIQDYETGLFSARNWKRILKEDFGLTK